MAVDALSTSLAGLGVGALGVLVLAVLNWPVVTRPPRNAVPEPRQALLFTMFFTFLMGFLYTFALAYAALSLPVAGGFGGALFGGFAWLAFVLPVDLTQVVWGEDGLPRHARNLVAWLVQLMVGGAFAGTLIAA